MISTNTENRLITCDVWDTLIRRDCHPEAIKFQSARFVFFNYLGNFKNVIRSAKDIYICRLSIERELGKSAQSSGFDDEYCIFDVTEKLLQRVIETSFIDLKQKVQEVVRFEVEREIKHTYQDPKIRHWVESRSSEKAKFISDFYMPASLLNEILHANQVSDFVNGGLSSCDAKLNKRSGNLFKYARKHFATDFNRWEHIGDNQHSDVKVPSEMGIKTQLHYIEQEENKKLSCCELFDQDELWIRRCIETITPIDGCTSSNNLFNAGLEFAPLFTGFCHWLLEESLYKDVTKIVFATREGSFLKACFDAFSENTADFFKSSDIDTVWFETSRYALLHAKPFDLKRYENVWKQYGIRGVERFLSQHGICSASAQWLLSEYNFSPEEIILAPDQDERFLGMISNEVFKHENTQYADINLKSLLNYLTDIGVSDVDSILFVDVGWFGTAQDLTQHILEDLNISGAYIGVRRRNDSIESNKSGFLFDENDNQSSSQLSKFCEVFEVLTASPTPSVTSYKTHANGKTLPEHDNQDSRGETSTNVSIFQDGVLAGVVQLSKNLAYSKLEAESLKDIGLRMGMEVLKNPPTQLASLYFGSPRHDIFRETDLTQRDKLPNYKHHVMSLWDPTVREEVILFYRSIQWESGLMTQIKDLSWHRRVFYKVVVRLASKIKQIKK